MSSFWNRLVQFFNKEAKDVGEFIDSAKDKLDDELTRRERELEMSPSEKIEAITKASDEQDAEFERIIDKAEQRSAQSVADAEVETAWTLVSDDTAEALKKAETRSSAQGSSQTETEEPSETGTSAEIIASEKTDAEIATEKAGTKEDIATEDGAKVDNADRQSPVSKAPVHEKTMGEMKYERARAAADDLLEELRDELDIDDR